MIPAFSNFKSYPLRQWFPAQERGSWGHSPLHPLLLRHFPDSHQLCLALTSSCLFHCKSDHGLPSTLDSFSPKTPTVTVTAHRIKIMSKNLKLCISMSYSKGRVSISKNHLVENKSCRNYRYHSVSQKPWNLSLLNPLSIFYSIILWILYIHSIDLYWHIIYLSKEFIFPLPWKTHKSPSSPEITKECWIVSLILFYS